MKLNLIIILAIFFSMAFFSLSVVSAGTCPNGIGVCDETIPFQSANNVITPAINYTTALNGSYVPYSGATSNVDLGAKQLLTTGKGTFGSGQINGNLNISGNFSGYGTSFNYGLSSSVTGSNGVAISELTTASTQAVAIGYRSRATATQTVAIGRLAQSTQTGAISIGYGPIASEYYATAIGLSVVSSGVGSTAIGFNNGIALNATGRGAVAIGMADTNETILSSGIGSVAIGRNLSATANSAFAFGKGFTNSLADSFGVGFGGLNYQFTNRTANFTNTDIITTGNATILGRVGVGIAPNSAYNLYAYTSGTTVRTGIYGAIEYSGSEQNPTGVYAQIYGGSSNAFPKATGGLFQAYNYGTNMRNLGAGKSSTTTGGLFTAQDRVNANYGPNGTHFFYGGWFYTYPNLGNWTSNPTVQLIDGTFGINGFNESAWGTNSEHYAIYAYPAKNGVDFSSNNVTTTGGITASKLNITGNVAIGGNLSVKRPYWTGYDNSTQNFLNTANAQVINISNNEDYDSYGIRVVGNQNLTFDMTGDYLCTLSPEFFQNGGGALVTFWYQKCTSGVCVDARWSNSRYSMSNNEYHAPAIPYQFDITDPATETVRFMWWSDSTSTQIYSSGALTLPTRPSIPGIILNCQKVSEIT